MRVSAMGASAELVKLRLSSPTTCVDTALSVFPMPETAHEITYILIRLALTEAPMALTRTGYGGRPGH